MVTWENYEEYMVLHADGELQAGEAKELMAFVAQHPELREEMELYAAVKFVPETTIVYADKDALMRPVPARKKVIAMPVWQRYAVAAGVAAILCLSVLKYKESTVGSLSIGSPVAGSLQSGSKTVGNPVVGSLQSGGTAGRSGTPQVAIAVTKSTKTTKSLVIKTEAIGETNVVHESIAQLVPVEAKAMPLESVPVRLAEVGSVPVVVLNEAEDIKKTLLDALPIEDIKKDGMTDMANALAQTYKKMNALKHSITDEKNITVRVQKKQLILSF